MMKTHNDDTDDTYLPSVVHDVNASARELNNDLKKINKWVFQKTMSFIQTQVNKPRESSLVVK